MPFCLSVHLSAHLSVCLFVCLSIFCPSPFFGQYYSFYWQFMKLIKKCSHLGTKPYFPVLATLAKWTKVCGFRPLTAILITHSTSYMNIKWVTRNALLFGHIGGKVWTILWPKNGRIWWFPTTKLINTWYIHWLCKSSKIRFWATFTKFWPTSFEDFSMSFVGLWQPFNL